MTSEVLVPAHATHPKGSLPDAFSALAQTARWTGEMRRRCKQARARGRRLDDATLQRIAHEVDAWAASR